MVAYPHTDTLVSPCYYIIKLTLCSAGKLAEVSEKGERIALELQ